MIPYLRLTLAAADPPEVVAARLRSAVTSRRFFLRRPQRPFRGTITGRRFKLVRAQSIFQRDGSEPVILGDLVPVAGGTEVHIRMRPHAFDFGAPVFWLCVFALWVQPGAFRDHPSFVLPFLGFGAAFYAFLVVWFWTRAKRARALLCEHMGCREVERPNRLVRS